MNRRGFSGSPSDNSYWMTRGSAQSIEEPDSLDQLVNELHLQGRMPRGQINRPVETAAAVIETPPAAGHGTGTGSVDRADSPAGPGADAPTYPPASAGADTPTRPAASAGAAAESEAAASAGPHSPAVYAADALHMPGSGTFRVEASLLGNRADTAFAVEQSAHPTTNVEQLLEANAHARPARLASLLPRLPRESRAAEEAVDLAEEIASHLRI